MKPIVHLTTLHPRADTRIYRKEIVSLAQNLDVPIVLMVADGEGTVKRDENSVKIIDLGELGKSRLKRVISGYWKAANQIFKLKPSVVHFHDHELLLLGAVISVLGYKVVYDSHEDLPRLIFNRSKVPLLGKKMIYWILYVIEWSLTLFVDRVVVATYSIGTKFKSSKTTIVQNFPLIGEMYSSTEHIYSERRNGVVFVGYATKIRGAFEMVDAIGRVANVIDDAKLEIGGSFHPENLQKTLQDEPGWKNVEYHGYVSRSQMAEIFGKSRAGLVLFHPVPNHIEAQPTKMFEYMSAGLPVIASDFPLWRKIIKEVGCGLLVNPLDPGEIADAITWILQNEEEALTMGKRGKDAVSSIYNWEAESHKLVSLYRDTLL